MPYNYFDPDPEEQDWGVFSGPGVSPLYWNDPDLARTLPRSAPQVGMGGGGPPGQPEPQQSMAPPPPPPQQDDGGPPPPYTPGPQETFTPGPEEAPNMSVMPPQPEQPPPPPRRTYKLGRFEGMDRAGEGFGPALVREALRAGLDPNKVAAVLQSESGFGADTVAEMSDDHVGLLQFSRDAWNSAARKLGSSVPWEDIPKLSAEEQLPYVMQYFRSNGVTGDDDVGAYKTATLWPLATRGADDTVLYSAGDMRKVPGENFTYDKAYKDNAGLDHNKDGRVTREEAVRRTVQIHDRAMRRGTVDVDPGDVEFQPQQLGQFGEAAAYNQQFPGLAVKGVQFTGRPLSRAEIADRRDDIDKRSVEAQQTAAMMAMAQAGGQRSARMVLEQQALAEQKHAEEKLAAEQKAQVKAQQLRAKVLDEPLQKLDPQRYMRDMSTGKRIGALLSIALTGIGNALINAGGGDAKGNMALELLQKAIDDDINAQRLEIQTGEARRDNELMRLERDGVRSDQRILAMQAMHWGATAKLADIRAAELAAQGADTAGLLQTVQAIRERAAMFADQLQDSERQHQQIQLAPPPPPDPLAAERFATERAKLYAERLAAGQQVDELTMPLIRAREVQEDLPLQQALALQFARRANSVGGREQINRFMGEYDKLERATRLIDLLDGLENVRPDANGNYDIRQFSDNSEATGFLAKIGPNVVNITGDQKARFVNYVYDRFAGLERENWKTEYNGEETQKRMQEINRAANDKDRAFLMGDFRQALNRSRDLLYQNAPKDMLGYVLWNETRPTEAAPGVRRPGVIPLQ